MSFLYKNTYMWDILVYLCNSILSYVYLSVDSNWTYFVSRIDKVYCYLSTGWAIRALSRTKNIIVYKMCQRLITKTHQFDKNNSQFKPHVWRYTYNIHFRISLVDIIIRIYNIKTISRKSKYYHVKETTINVKQSIKERAL